MKLEQLQALVRDEFEAEGLEFVLIAMLEGEKLGVSVGQTSTVKTIEMLTAGIHHVLAEMDAPTLLEVLGAMLLDLGSRRMIDAPEQGSFELGGFDA